MDKKEIDRLDTIEKTLLDIHKILKPTRTQLLIEGLWRGFGYIVGLMVAVAILGWFLNILGILPFMTEFSQEMKKNLDIVKTK